MLVSTRTEAWKQLAANNNLLDGKHNELMIDTSKLINALHYTIFDSGSTGNFRIEGAPVVNKCVAINPVSVTLPTGKTIMSTHKCNLDIPWLPHKITEAHIVPGLSHSLLILTMTFCDVGCKVQFDEKQCKV